MKRLVRVLVFGAIGLLLQVVNSQAAPLTCPVMEITFIAPSGIIAKNVSGSACGPVADQSTIYLALNPATQDRLLAIALSAMSLQKTVWLHALGDTAGSITDAISIASN